MRLPSDSDIDYGLEAHDAHKIPDPDDIDADVEDEMGIQE
jgi:hypothetical protein